MSLLGYNKKQKQNKTKQKHQSSSRIDSEIRVAFEKIQKDPYDISNVFTYWNDVDYNYHKEIKCNRLSIKLLL